MASLRGMCLAICFCEWRKMAWMWISSSSLVWGWNYFLNFLSSKINPEAEPEDESPESFQNLRSLVNYLKTCTMTWRPGIHLRSPTIVPLVSLLKVIAWLAKKPKIWMRSQAQAVRCKTWWEADLGPVSLVLRHSRQRSRSLSKRMLGFFNEDYLSDYLQYLTMKFRRIHDRSRGNTKLPWLESMLRWQRSRLLSLLVCSFENPGASYSGSSRLWSHRDLCRKCHPTLVR